MKKYKSKPRTKQPKKVKFVGECSTDIGAPRPLVDRRRSAPVDLLYTIFDLIIIIHFINFIHHVAFIYLYFTQLFFV